MCDLSLQSEDTTIMKGPISTDRRRHNRFAYERAVEADFCNLLHWALVNSKMMERNSKASKVSIWHSWGATVRLAMASLLRNKQCDCIRMHKIHSHNTSSKFAWQVTQMISRAYLHTSQKSVEARSNPTWLSACTIAPSAKACILLGHLPRCFPFVVIEPF